MKIPKKLNEDGKIFGVPIVELGMVLAIPVGGTVIINIIGTFISVPNIIFVVLIAIGVIAIVILRRANKEGNPSFISSWISYNYFQPKKVIISKPLGYEPKTIRKAIEEHQKGI